MAEQNSAHARSCVTGNKLTHNPDTDQLAEQGLRDTNACSPDPLLVPMPTSLMTGRFPHETGVLANGKVNEDIDLEKQEGQAGMINKKRDIDIKGLLMHNLAIARKKKAEF